MRCIRKKMQRVDTRNIQERPKKAPSKKRSQHTHNRYQALSIPETIREEDEAEEPIYVFDKSDNGTWIKEEVVVDSGAVECATSKKRMLHLRVEETPESRRGETWTCAGGNEIKGRQSNRQLADRFGHHAARGIQSRTGVENTDQSGQTPRHGS